MEYGICKNLTDGELMLHERDLAAFPALCSLRCPPLAKLSREVIEVWRIALPAHVKDQMALDEKTYSQRETFVLVPGYARLNVREHAEAGASESAEPSNVAHQVLDRCFSGDSEADLKSLVYALNSDDKQERKHASSEFLRLFPRHGVDPFHPAYTLPLLMNGFGHC